MILLIQTRAKSLVQLIDKKRTLRTEKDNVEAYKTRKYQLHAEVVKVVTLFKKVALMWEYKICENRFEDDIQSLSGLITNLQKDFKEKPDWINKQGALTPLSSKVEFITTRIEDELKIKWREYIEKGLPSINRELLNILEQIPSFRNKVLSIKKLNAEMIQYKEKLAANEMELLLVVKKKQQFLNEWNSLGAEDVPENVLAFLRVSATQGAALNLLTPDILTWLQRNKIQSFFKIRLE